MKEKRSYAEEMAWAIETALMKNHDRNPNRIAQVTGVLRYGMRSLLLDVGMNPFRRGRM